MLSEKDHSLAARIQMKNVLLLLFAGLALVTPSLQGQTLDKLREEVRKAESKEEKPNANKKKHSKLHWADPHQRCTPYFAGLSGPFVQQDFLNGYAPLATTTKPTALSAGASEQDSGLAENTPPPEEDSVLASESSIYKSINKVTEPSLPGYSRLSIEGGTNFGRLSRFGIRGRLERASILGLEASGNRFFERRSAGGSDALSLGDINLSGRLISDSVMRVRVGVGANWLNDQIDTNFGINLTASGELFFTEHLYTEFEFDGGRLGSSQLLHMRAQAGYVWGVTELFIGYDHYSIGSAKLHGLVSGVGLRF